MFSLNEMEIFLAAADLGNFSHAAKRLQISQPAVSQAISSLERQFGIDLFQRHGRAVKLTDSGQVLKPIARELLATARRVNETMASLQGEVVGEINIGCSTTSGKYLLPGLIARFCELFPEVRLNVMVNTRDTILNLLLAGQISLSVTSQRVDHHDLEYKNIFTDDVVLIVPARHPWSSDQRIYADDLLDVPIILREEGSGTMEVMTEGLLQNNISLDMLNVAMVLGSAEAIELAVEEGIGAAFISRLAASRCIASGRVIEIEVEGMHLTRDIYMVRNRRQVITRAQAEYWDFVVEKEIHFSDSLIVPV